MAQWVGYATGNWSTAATWGEVTNTPTIHATTNITVSNSNIFTATFTAPNTTNKCIGVLVYYNIFPTSNALTATLQESSVDTTATATVTWSTYINASSAGAWVFFKFASPYTFTTTTAGTYRFRLVHASSTSSTLAADSGGSNPAFLAVDDRTGPPAATDDVFIAGNNGANAITVTMDGTQTVGSGTDIATSGTMVQVPRTVGAAIVICNAGTLAYDISANTDLTVKGQIMVCENGTYQKGTLANPVPSNITCKTHFNEGTAAANYGIYDFLGSKHFEYGAPTWTITQFSTKYSSGSGTTGSPLITADAVNWNANDEIWVGPTSSNAANYNEGEFKFIKVKNSSTSYTLSDTAGGVESGLANTHTTDAWILNLQRNVLTDTTDTTKGFFMASFMTVASSLQFYFARFETFGVSSGSRNGLILNNSTGGDPMCDYCVVYRHSQNGFMMQNTSATRTFTGNIAIRGTQVNTTGGFFLPGNVSNKTFTNCFAGHSVRSGFYLTGAFNSIFNTCYIIGCNSGAAVNVLPLHLQSSGTLTFNNCELHCNRTSGISLQGVSNTTFNTALVGTKGTNAIDIFCLSGSSNDVTFINSTFGSATLISQYLLQNAGSAVKFSNFNNTTNDHRWYTNYGSATSTGATLPDTTVRTSGSLGVRLRPEDNTTGFQWVFNVPAPANSIINFFGYFQKNVTFGSSTAKVELFLPGTSLTGTADATTTLSNTTGTWQAASISANYTGTVSSLASVRISGISATAGAYLYIDDLYNAGDGASTTSDKVTGLDTWNNGQPITIIAPSAVSPSAIWTFDLSNVTTSGVAGTVLKKALSVAKFLALK